MSSRAREISGGTADTAMIQHLAGMKWQTNTRSYWYRIHNRRIYNLPVEILEEIFIWLKIMSPCSPRGAFAWSPILSVCRAWHEVATSCPFLWSELEFSLDIPRSYFTYSGLQPLTLWWDQQDSAPGVTLDQRSAYLPRARRLLLDGLPQDNGAQACHGLTSFPLLEELVLHTTSDAPLAEVFISGHYPKLTRLFVILEEYFQWHYTIFSPNLQHLEMHNSGVLESGALAVLIDGLRNMPLLESLRLINPCIYVDTVPSALKLPKLQYLSLEGTVEICTALLECFTLPLNTNIDIRCELLLDDDNDVQVPQDALFELSEALQSKIALRDDSGSLLSPPIKYMLAQQYEFWNHDAGFEVTSGAARLRLLRSDEPLVGRSLQKNLLIFDEVRCEKNFIHRGGLREDLEGIQVMFTWAVAEHKTFQPLAIWPAVICQSLPLEQVTTVSMDLESFTTSMGVGRMCPNVTTVIAKDAEDEINGLRYLLDTDDNGKRRADRPHFPKMKTLVLDHLDVSRPTSFRQELDRLRLSLRALRISRTLTLEKFYFARQDPVVSLIVENYLPNLKAIRAAFPEIDISLLDENFSKWA